MKRSFVLATLAFLAIGIHAERAEAQVDTDGAVQLGLSGFALIGSDFTSISTVFSLTRFATESLEIGGDLQLTFSDFDNDSEVSGFALGRVRYNFVGQGLTIPFLSFGAGTQLDDPGEDQARPVIFQGGVGFKRFLNDQVSFNGEALSFATLIDGTFKVESSVFIVFGLAIYLR